MKKLISILSIVLLSGSLYAQMISYHKEVNVPKLAEEIEANLSYRVMKHYSTETVHGYIMTSGSKVKLYFNDTLSTSEISDLDSILEDHIK